MDILVPRSLVANPDAFGGVVSGDCLRGTPVIATGRLMRLDPLTGGAAQIVLPHLVEPHCHLDKCHTIHRIGQVGGDLAHAIRQQMQDKANWSEDDIRTRVQRGIGEAQANGCRHIRTHVDWSDSAAPPLRSTGKND